MACRTARTSIKQAASCKFPACVSKLCSMSLQLRGRLCAVACHIGRGPWKIGHANPRKQHGGMSTRTEAHMHNLEYISDNPKYKRKPQG